MSIVASEVQTKRYEQDYIYQDYSSILSLTHRRKSSEY